MTIEVLPVGQTCNLMCPYCYEHPLRDAANYGPDYDMDKLKQGLIDQIKPWNNLRGGFTIFGGEPLLMPIDDLEELIAWGTEEFKDNVMEGHNVVSIQSNGVLVTDRHIEIFKKYNVTIGVSVDGPKECNDSRWAGTLKKTRERTEMSMNNIKRMIEAGIHVSLIITLWRGNVAKDRRSKFKAWVRKMHKMGVGGARLHLLEVDHEKINEWELTTNEYIEFLSDMYREIKELPGWSFDLFTDIKDLLRGSDSTASCIYHACDPYTTSAVQGIDGEGTRVNCGRADHTGVDWEKADQVGYERYLGLYHTQFDDGGCGGCRFFLMCKGQCPGTGELGDWRHKTSHCEVLLGIYEMMENELLAEGVEPFSIASYRENAEAIMMNAWAEQNNPSLQSVIDEAKSMAFKAEQIVRDSQGNVVHSDASLQIIHSDGATIESHGDSPHGDSADPSNKLGGPSDSFPRPDARAPSDHGDTPHGDSINPDNKFGGLNPVTGIGGTPHGDSIDPDNKLGGLNPTAEVGDTPHGDSINPDNKFGGLHPSVVSKWIPHGDSPHGDSINPDNTFGGVE